MRQYEPQDLPVGASGTSVIRWAGSKRRLLPLLLQQAPREYLRYVEPFCGSASLFFALKPQSALLTDINNELITTLRVLEKHPETLFRALAAEPRSLATYNRYRQQNPGELPPFKRAKRFMYLNRYCFNGVYRTNRAGLFNVPIGKRTGAIPDLEIFSQCSRSLKAATLRCCDFQAALATCSEGDFVYLDPPYYKIGRNRGEYGNSSFDKADLPRLAEVLKQLDNIRAKFIMSYSDTEDFVRRIPDRWKLIRIGLQRHVSGFRSSAHHVTEILIKNF